MKKILIIPFLIITVMIFGQNTKNFIDQNYIEVTGKAEIEVVPDEIYVSIVVQEADTKGKITVEALEKNMIKKLIDLKIDVEKDLTVKDMASNFKDYWLKRSDIFKSKQYLLKVNDAATAGKVFQELEKLGISNMGIDKVDHSEIEKFRRDVKVKAVVAAKEKADGLAEAIGQKAGRALYIREIENFYGPIRQPNMLMRSSAMKMEDSAALPEISFEAIKLEYSVQVYFELE
ncbi:MAG TPA: SIMPL domain-containing protein [Prolixibacteraceae bacterium]|nr:SIMPL domain-containing protein [Prolixibacteraceae bacterium]